MALTWTYKYLEAITFVSKKSNHISKKMFKDTKKSLEDVLERNELITDLSEFPQEESSLTHVLESLKKKTNIGKIIWSQSQPDHNASSACSILKEEIHQQIIANNQNYEKFPSDYIHCLLSSHVYSVSSPKMAK